MAKEKRKPLHEWTNDEMNEIDCRREGNTFLKLRVMLSKFCKREVAENEVAAELYEILEELKTARYATGAAWRKKTYAG